MRKKSGNDLRRDAFIADVEEVIDLKSMGPKPNFSVERFNELERMVWSAYARVPA